MGRAVKWIVDIVSAFVPAGYEWVAIVLALGIFLLVFGYFWIAHTAKEIRHQILEKEGPRPAPESDRFLAMAFVADSRNGKFEMVGRMGKLTCVEAGNPIEVKGRRSGTSDSITFSANVANKPFRLFMSSAPQTRGGLVEMQTGNSFFDKTFTVNASAPALASSILNPDVQKLFLNWGRDTVVAIDNGKLSIKRGVREVTVQSIQDLIETGMDFLHFLNQP